MKAQFLVTLILAPFVFAGCSTVQKEPTDAQPVAGMLGPEGDAGDADAFDPLADEFDPLADDLDLGSDYEEASNAKDPLEPFNRVMHGFNDKFYFLALRPVSQAYGTVAPEPMRQSVKNFFYNLRYPVRLVNTALQGKFHESGRETTRFLMNSTYGVLGLFTPSDKYPNLQPPREDFGQTFGTWGVNPGPYIVLPILGPTTLRDGVGRVGDSILDPVSWIDSWNWRAGVNVYDRVNETSLRIGEYENLKDAAVDPYSSIKDVYLKIRANAVEE